MRHVLLAAMAGLFALPALADTLTYRNDRFGTSVTFPANRFVQAMEPPANGDGMTFLSNDGASIAIYGQNNALMVGPAELADQAGEARAGFEVTYRRVGDDWVVLSGHEDGHIFYHRFLFGADDVIHAVLLKYPPEARAVYDPFVGAIAGSLDGP